jgi:aryl-alcohol dehydrogenase-like predicted oxidoreductase
MIRAEQKEIIVETVEIAPGYRISRIVKGNWQLAERHGPSVAREEAVAGMRRFVEAGVTAFDCADHYVGVEETIGAFRRQHPDLARAVKIHTKIVPDRDQLPVLRREDIVALVDRSLDRLGVDMLDMVQFHWWDYAVSGAVEAMGWLADLRAAGKIDLLGTTNFDTAHLRAFIDAGLPLVSNQLQYSVLDRRPEKGLASYTKDHGIALQCYGAVAGGFLSARWLGAPDPEPPFANRSLVKYRLIIDEFGSWAAFQALLQALDRVARLHGVSLTAVATRWVLDRPGVATAIVGARTAEHLADIVSIATLHLSPEDRAEIDVALTPGPPGDCYDLERETGGRHASIMWTNQNAKGAGAR